jgi:glycosyltransferase involved in cell wall biosynthesis
MIVDSLKVGGREKVVFNLSNKLSESNEVHIVTLSNNHNELESTLKPGVKVHALPFAYEDLGGLHVAALWFKGIGKLSRLLKQLNADIIHTHLLFQRFLLATIAVKKSGVKARLYQTVHTLGLYYSGKGLMNAIRLTTEKQALKIYPVYLVTVSDEVRKICEKHFYNKAKEIRTIFNGVDTKTFNYQLKSVIPKEYFGFTNGDMIITCLARMDAGKDHLTLLRAFKKIIATHQHVKLCLAGDGEEKGKLQSYVNTEDLAQRIHFLNTVHEPEKLLAITDVGVSCSLFEGFSMGLIEQMIMKVPVVVTNIPSFSSVIENGQNGFLFSPGNADELAAHLTNLIRNPSVRTETATKAYASALKFSVDNMARLHMDYYNLHA